MPLLACNKISLRGWVHATDDNELCAAAICSRILGTVRGGFQGKGVPLGGLVGFLLLRGFDRPWARMTFRRHPGVRYIALSIPGLDLARRTASAANKHNASGEETSSLHSARWASFPPPMLPLSSQLMKDLFTGVGREALLCRLLLHTQTNVRDGVEGCFGTT